MNLVRTVHPHRAALLVLLVLGALLGVRAAKSSAHALYPAVAFPRIAVIAERGEDAVRNVLVATTLELERAVAAVPGLVRVRSKTVRGACELGLDFRPETEMRDALALVRARIGAAVLPPGTRTVVEQQTPAVFPVSSFTVVPSARDAADPLARARVAEWAETVLEPRLLRLPDTFQVTVLSGDRREYVFGADPTRLVAAGVGIVEVVEALQSADREGAVGRLQTQAQQLQVLVDGRFRSPADILATCIPRGEAPPVRLAELGVVEERTAERTRIVTGGDGDAVVVSVFLRDGGRVTDLSRDVATVLAEEAGHVPGGGSIVPVYDQARLVEEAIAGVRDAIALGALLAVVVLWLFLGDWRATIVAGLSIPLSVALTVAALPLFSESLNLMSLGGLAVAIGLVIDDTIVVVENVVRRLRTSGLAPFAAIAEGTQDVLSAIVGSSLTTVVVFVPLVLLDGVVGLFFRSLALALGISVLTSLVISLVYAPLLLLWPPLVPRAARERRFATWLGNALAMLVAGALARARLTAALALLVLAGGVAALRDVRTGFLPEFDEGGFVLDYALPVGTSLSETDAACRRIEAILKSTSEVGALSRRTGAELGFFATEQFTGDMLVGLVPRAARKRSVFAVIEELRDRLAQEVPAAEVEFVQVMQDTIADLSGNPEPLEIKLLGQDYKALQRAADAVEHALVGLADHGIVDVKNHVSFGSPELVWRPDPARLARLGLTNESVAADVTAQQLGGIATRLREGERFVDVRVRYGERWRAAKDGGDSAPDLQVWPKSPFTRPVPLRAVASFESVLTENELERENQVPMVRVTAKVEGTDLGSASALVRRVVLALPQEAGVRVEFDGQQKSQKSAFERLTLVFGLAAGLVFLLLAAQFRSLRLPLVLFAALPFGQIGALLVLQSCGVALDVSSAMGLVLLVGLAVKNGIILIEYAQRLVASGSGETDALVEAARVRLRPILMTTLATIAGLAPLALGVGAGAELQRPLAIAVIGGLVVATLATLIVVPLGCQVLARGRLVTEAVRGS